MKTLLLIALGLLSLGGLFLWMKPAPPPVAAAPVVLPAASQPTAAAPAPSAEQRVELVVAGERLVSGPQVVTVTEGTALVLRVTSDARDELHLHGYDLTLPLAKGVAGELRLVADRSGRFEYELHHGHRTLGVLEVLPR
jgi:hypothetical protein